MKKVICTLIALVLFSPIFLTGQEVSSLPLSTFNSIEISSDMNIFLTQGPQCGVFFDGPDELKNDIQVKIDGKGVLRLIFGEKMKKAEKANQLREIKVYFKAPQFNMIKLSKSASLITESDIEGGDKIEINLSDNASFISKKINAKDIIIKLNGNAKFYGTLYAKTLKMDGAANSKLNIPEGIISKSMIFNLKGRAEAQIDKATSDGLTVNTRDNTIINVMYDGKTAQAKTAGNSQANIAGSASTGTFSAKDVSIINIVKFQCPSVKTSTEKSGAIQR